MLFVTSIICGKSLRSGPDVLSSALTCLLLVVVVMVSACSARTADEHLDDARAYVSAGEGDAAIIEFKNALKQDASLIDARSELADLLFASGDYRAAEVHYGRALTLAKDADSPFSRRLVNAIRLCKIRMRQAAEVISELNSSGSDAQYGDLSGLELALLGHARLALDDAELAQKEFESALKIDEDIALAHFGLALIAWREGDLPGAEHSFTRAAALDARDPELLLSKAEFELSQRNLVAARESFNLAQSLPGNNVIARLGAARVLVYEENYTAASAEVDDILTTAPDLVPAFYLQALVAYERGDLEVAQGHLRNVLSRQKNYAQGLYLMGAVQFQKKEFLQAEANLSAYISLDPGSVFGRRLLAAVRMQTGNFEGVVTALEPVKQQTTDAQTLAMLGSAYARLGRLNEASVLLDRAVGLAPDVSALRNQLAVTLLAAGESAQAIGQLESAINLDGELQLSDYLLVLAQLREGKMDEALAAANALFARAPQDPMGENLLGAVYFAQGDVDAARAAFVSSLEKKQGFQPAALNLARLEIAEGNRSAAVRVLEDLLTIDTDNEHALLQLAELEMRTQANQKTLDAREVSYASRASFNRARNYLQRAVQAHPNSLEPRLALARLGLSEGDTEAALRESGQALDIAPDNPGVLAIHIESLLLANKQAQAMAPLKSLELLLSRSSQGQSAHQLTLARLLEQAQQPQRAESAYTALLNSEPPMRDRALLALARIQLRDDDVDGARRRLVEVSEDSRESQLFRLLQADVSYKAGDLVGATSDYESLVGEDSRDALFRLMALYMETGEPQRAKALLAHWLVDHPLDGDAEVALATQLLGRGDFRGAQERFESVLERSPESVVVLNNLAWLYQQTGDPRAREVARRAWSLAPDNADVADTYGWILLEDGELERGRELLVKANQRAPHNAAIGFHAAKALAETGRTEQAIVILREFDLPEGSEASALLRKLRAVDEVEVETE